MISRRDLVGTVLPVLVLAGCQAAAGGGPAAVAEPVTFSAPNGVGYLFLDAPIFTRTRELLLQDVTGLVGAGARTIRLAINSPGGDVVAARAIVDDMNRLHSTQGITFETYGTGLVASAATYVFLAGQRRYARNGSGFLFHAAGLVSNGAVSAERLREEAAKIEDYERLVRALLKARTRLTDGAIDVYLHRTVILNADDAMRDGVVDAIQPFAPPAGVRVITIAARRAAPAGAAPVAPPTNGR